MKIEAKTTTKNRFTSVIATALSVNYPKFSTPLEVVSPYRSAVKKILFPLKTVLHRKILIALLLLKKNLHFHKDILSPLKVVYWMLALPTEAADRST